MEVFVKEDEVAPARPLLVLALNDSGSGKREERLDG
jgi:hypothetical protein